MGIVNSLKTRGFRGTIQQGILKALGLKQQKEEIDSLYYYLNSYCDITSLPPTKNENLRNLQLGILELLRIFDKLCKKNDLVYWLDSGNLLGAYRHKGFIPWDDDMDVAMPREDYNKAQQVQKLYTEVSLDTSRWCRKTDQEALPLPCASSSRCVSRRPYRCL